MESSPFAAQPSSRDIAKILPAMAQAAQEIYDSWKQDADGHSEDLGAGGICDLIATAMVNAIRKAHPSIENLATEQTSVGENHIYAVAGLADGVFEIDIPARVYETGSGFVWRKRPGIKFSSQDVVITCLSRDPRLFHQFTTADLRISI